MDKICEQLEHEWKIRLQCDVKLAYEQQQDYKRHTMTIYYDVDNDDLCPSVYDPYREIIVWLSYDTINEWTVTYEISKLGSGYALMTIIDYHWKSLDYILHTSFSNNFNSTNAFQLYQNIKYDDEYKYEKIVQNAMTIYKKRYIDDVLLEICIVTLLELYANTHFYNLRNIERILADDYLVKMILSKMVKAYNWCYTQTTQFNIYEDLGTFEHMSVHQKC